MCNTFLVSQNLFCCKLVKVLRAECLFLLDVGTKCSHSKQIKFSTDTKDMNNGTFYFFNRLQATENSLNK